MKLAIAIAVLSCSIAACGDKGGASASAKTDPAVTEAFGYHAKWEAACKADGERNAKNKAAKAVIDEAVKQATFKSAYESAEPAKYADNYCANMLRAATGAALEKKQRDKK